MSHDKPNDNKNQGNAIPDSSTKKASGSTKVHSELDNSTKKGYQPKDKSEEE